jgi:WD40 repeat protein
MINNKEFLTQIENFLSTGSKKLLLILDDLQLTCLPILQLYLRKKHNKFVYYLNLQATNSEEIKIRTVEQAIIVLVLPELKSNASLENYYYKYQLNKYPAKIIFVVNKLLLHPTLDPSIYFAPIERFRIQKQSLTQLDLVTQFVMQKPIVNKSMSAPKVYNKQLQRKDFELNFLNKKLMTNDAQIMQMIADRVRESKEYKDFLLQIIYASRLHITLDNAAANAITALNHARIPFTTMDLSSIKIPKADMSKSICYETNFDSADLTGVSFKDAIITGASFDNCLMSDVFFEELPYILTNEKISNCCYSSDQKFLAAYLENAQILIYSLSDLQVKLAIETEYYSYDDFDINPRNNYLACASRNHANTKIYKLEIWDLNATPIAKKHTLKKHKSPINNIKFSRDGLYLISIDNEGNIFVWDIDNNFALIRKIKWNTAPYCNIDVYATYMLRSCGDYIELRDFIKAISTTKNNIIRFSLRNHLGDFESSEINTLRISANGEYVAAGDANYRLIIWGRNHSFLQIFEGHSAEITSIDYNNDNEYIVTASKDHTVRLWSIKAAACINVIQSHKDEVNAVRFSPDNKTIVSVSADHSIRFWHLRNNVQNDKITTRSQNIRSLHISPNGKLLVSLGKNLEIKIWQLATGDCLYALAKYFEENEVLSKGFWSDSILLCFSYNNQYLAFGDGLDTIAIWNIEQAKYLNIICGIGFQFNLISFTLDNKSLLIAGNITSAEKSTCIIQKWNIDGLEKITLLEYGVTADQLVLSPNNRFLALVRNPNYSEVSIVYVFDLTNKYKKILEIPCKDLISNAAFSPNELLLAISCGTGLQTIYLWDLNKGKHMHTFTPDQQDFAFSEDYINYDWASLLHKDILLFSLDMQYLLTVDGVSLYPGLSTKGLLPLRVWSIKTGQLLRIIEVDKVTAYAVKFIDDRLLLATANNDEGSIKFWQQSNKLLLKAKWCLLWSSNPVLNANKSKLTYCQGLSKENHQLLQQHGANIDSSSEENNNNNHPKFYQ